ncbi:hypothetical protein [Actinoplanes awajinensis]|uniref:hypothetical protein n=1 Tax=Actinoplanes awajinensis TaxID=135946 RepID=UPI000B3056E8|nr:hypothetical protein [Actinoplanes awajinensis]
MTVSQARPSAAVTATAAAALAATYLLTAGATAAQAVKATRPATPAQAAAAAQTVAAAQASTGAADLRPRPQHLTDAQRSKLLDATRRFRDVRQAIEAGYLPTEDCVPGMGLHYAHPQRSADSRIDPEKPEILLYLPGPHGTVRLTGVEYFRADADGELRTDRDRPNLFGHPFNGPMTGHAVPAGAPPMPVHYDLHVWLYERNPDGELATLNPTITCR